jgi:hypothetical protein
VAIVRDETTSRLKNIVQDPADINVNFYRCPDTNLARISFQTRRSATDTTTRADTVSLKQIRANHLADPIVYNANLSFVNIPLDEAADAAVFYLDYLDGSIDTVDLEYTRNFVQYYKSCGEQVIFSGLLRDHDNINIIQSQVQFPPVTNIEILH